MGDPYRQIIDSYRRNFLKDVHRALAAMDEVLYWTGDAGEDDPDLRSTKDVAFITDDQDQKKLQAAHDVLISLL